MRSRVQATELTIPSKATYRAVFLSKKLLLNYLFYTSSCCFTMVSILLTSTFHLIGTMVIILATSDDERAPSKNIPEFRTFLCKISCTYGMGLGGVDAGKEFIGLFALQL